LQGLIQMSIAIIGHVEIYMYIQLICQYKTSERRKLMTQTINILTYNRIGGLKGSTGPA
jgi:hypothetical protein